LLAAKAVIAITRAALTQMGRLRPLLWFAAQASHPVSSTSRESHDETCKPHLHDCQLLRTGAGPGSNHLSRNPNCRIAGLVPPPAQPVVWKGGCRDGYADGKGVLEWKPADKPALVVEGVMAKGQFAGEATLRDSTGLTYIGTLLDGQPHGNGYFKYPDGARYEGGVANGQPEGAGVKLTLMGNRYEGTWKLGKRDGFGRETFALGGSYEGEWKHDKFEGAGTIVYAGTGRRYAGQFHDGRVDGLPPPPAATEKFYLKDDEPHTGSNIKDTLATTSYPPDAGWAALSPAAQALVKTMFPALEDGDEPPYPEQGIRPVYMLLREAARAYRLDSGTIVVLVTVEADGTASSAASIGELDEKVRRFASAATLAQRYKPARCHGQPCKMIFPYNFRFAWK
jgi:hypothetical protein